MVIPESSFIDLRVRAYTPISACKIHYLVANLDDLAWGKRTPHPHPALERIKRRLTLRCFVNKVVPYTKTGVSRGFPMNQRFCTRSNQNDEVSRAPWKYRHRSMPFTTIYLGLDYSSFCQVRHEFPTQPLSFSSDRAYPMDILGRASRSTSLLSPFSDVYTSTSSCWSRFMMRLARFMVHRRTLLAED